MSIKENDVIFLIGAGCSFDAGIPTTTAMIRDIETKIQTERKWMDLKDLYFYIKSAILYGEGILGRFLNIFSIEQFVNVLFELEKKERNVIYPFMATWNHRLIELAGKDFEAITNLKELITAQLVVWIKSRDNYKSASYYRKFYDFQKSLNHSIRVFTLNYDLCFEFHSPWDDALELGFDSNDKWNSARFEAGNPDVVNASIYLYKLHGSITWKRDKKAGNLLVQSAHPEENPDLIFGTNAKMQSIDPYLYYVFEFRRWSLRCKIMIIIGYSFSDSYINTLIKQSLQHNKDRRILVVDKQDADIVRSNVIQALELEDDSQLIIFQRAAKDFLENDLKTEIISEYLVTRDEEVFS